MTDDKARRVFKLARYYGMGPAKLLGVVETPTAREAREILELYRRAYPQTARWLLHSYLGERR